MDLAYPIAEYIYSTQFDHLPRETIASTKKFILDTMGVTIAGCRGQGIWPAYELFKNWGGKGESTVLVFGDKIPSMHAALINSTMCHAFEFDETHDEAVIHSFASILPASLAISELKGHVTGKDLITAVTIGVDLACRLALATPTPPRWIRSATTGIFGAIASVSKLLGFKKETILNALGIGYSLASGNEQCAVDGGLTKRMQPAFAAKAAIFSSLLAEKGITGAKEVFEGTYGYFNLYENGNYDPKRLMQGLGVTFEVENLSVKPYPCCRASHSAISGVLEMIGDNHINANEVCEVHIGTSQLVLNLVGRPYVLRRNPQVGAQFRLPYVLSVAILKGRVSLEDFEDESLKNSEVLNFPRKIKVTAIDKLKDGGLRAPCMIEIRTPDRRSFFHQVDVMKGHPLNPLTREERLRNAIKPGDKTIHGWKITSCGLEDCIKKSAEVSGWKAKRGKGNNRGIGMASMIHTGSGSKQAHGLNFSSAIIKVQNDGMVDVFTGAADLGQGSDTMVAQIVSEILGLSPIDVNVIASDTDLTPPNLGARGSRQTFMEGNAVRLAALDVRNQILENASRILNEKVKDLELKDREVYVKNRKDKAVPLSEIVNIFRDGVPIMGKGHYIDSISTGLDARGYGNFGPTYTFGCHVVEVEVDPETGYLKVLNVVAAHDVGKLINPMTSEGQFEGGISQGMGFALMEKIEWSKGEVTNPSFLGYKIPNVLDMPHIQTIFIKTNDPHRPFGAKGLAEPGLIPTAPALANAIYDAVGVRVKSLPITPEKIMKCIEERKKEEIEGYPKIAFIPCAPTSVARKRN
ncbi:MAG: molybdopterin-dependent oxidoreductase [Thermodesulfobacteriota bacterium]|nr:molybdopterin-dependent oxidoreductase [Thermodesulfobacteriota bacterium]